MWQTPEFSEFIAHAVGEVPSEIMTLAHEGRGVHVKATGRSCAWSIKQRPYYLSYEEWDRTLCVQAQLSTRTQSVPALVRGPSSCLIHEFDNSQFRICEWVDPAPCSAMAADQGRALASLHLILQEYPVTPSFNSSEPRQRFRTYPDRRQDWEALLSRIYPGECQPVGYAQPKDHYWLQQRVLELFSRTSSVCTPMQLVHGDAHIFNVVHGSAGLSWIDFDDCRLDRRLVDIVWWLSISAGYAWDGPGTEMMLSERLNFSYCNEFMQGYESLAQLDTAESALFVDLFELYTVAAFDNCHDREMLLQDKELLRHHLARLRSTMKQVRLLCV